MAGVLIDAHRTNAAKRRPGEPIHVTVRATEAAGTGTTLRVDIPQHEELGEMTVGDLKGLVAEAMSHAEVEEAELPLAAWGLQLYGRALNESFPLASFHVQDKDTMYLRVTPGQHDAAGVPINVERRYLLVLSRSSTDSRLTPYSFSSLFSTCGGVVACRPTWSAGRRRPR